MFLKEMNKKIEKEGMQKSNFLEYKINYKC